MCIKYYERNYLLILSKSNGGSLSYEGKNNGEYA